MMPPPQPRSRASISGCWERLESRSISIPGGPVTRSLVVTTSCDGEAMVLAEMVRSVEEESSRATMLGLRGNECTYNEQRTATV